MEPLSVIAPPFDDWIGNHDATFTSKDYIEIFAGLSINYGVFSLLDLTELYSLNQVSQF